MSAFAAIVRSAIVGTDQIAPPQTIGVAQADALLAAAADETAEQTLLRTAAIVGTIRRCARLPLRFETEPDVAPEELLPRCGPLAGADLRLMLDGERLPLLPEWLAHAAAFGRRVPEELLPKLLSRGARDWSLRSAIVAVCGARGRWLAACDPAWAYANATDDDAATFDESSDRSARVRALRSLRERDPATAREMLERSWAAESPDDRAALLAALDTNLSLADEPFIERARGDARREVRSTANELLHHLPDSQSAKRAIALATPLLGLKRVLFATSLTVALPEACTPEMRADGMEPKFQGGGRGPNLGDRAWWLRQLLEYVPLAHWRAAFDRSTTELLKLARAHDEYPMVLAGAFCAAIGGYRDASALAELLALAASDDYYVEHALAACAAFPGAKPDEAPFLAALRNQTAGATELIAAATRPWSVALSTAALDAARAGLAQSGDWNVHHRRGTYFALLAANVDPQTPGIFEGWPESYVAENTRDLVQKLLDTLQFRNAMHAHLKDDR
jgi:hypothetical protein